MKLDLLSNKMPRDAGRGASTSLRRALLLPLLLLLLPALARGWENGLATTPPRGFSTWQQWPDEMQAAHGHSVTEATCRSYLRGLVNHGLPALNYTYFIVDEPCFTGQCLITIFAFI